ncbi:MAG: T9SS type A sorting domain-containing protein [Chitinophagales bacterium]|jgi:hypothetical protein|nr:T9SS type A sorting domain-containing protein [Chitinophagales bacterium]
MKKLLIFFAFVCVYSFNQAQVAQNDTFTIHKDSGLYRFDVLRNDQITSNTIIDSVFVPNSSLYNVQVVNNSISFNKLDTSTFNLTFNYRIKDNVTQVTSTASVIVRVNWVFDSVFSGDLNDDGVVNYLDVLPYGVFYGELGNPRKLLESNLLFQAYKAAPWRQNLSGLNAKFTDADGNGVINETDFSAILSNFNKQSKPYTPKLSPASNSTKLIAKIGVDTVYLKSDTAKVKLNTEIESNLNLNARGLAFQYEVKLYDEGLFVKNINPENVSFRFSQGRNFNPDGLDVAILDSTNLPDSINQAALVRTYGPSNAGVGDVGAIEIVVVDVDIGLSVENTKEIRISFKDIAMIDDNFGLIPIRGDTTSAILARKPSHISTIKDLGLHIFPTQVSDKFTVKKDIIQPEEIKIYNSLGQQVYVFLMKSNREIIDIGHLTSGVYSLHIDGYRPQRLVKH